MIWHTHTSISDYTFKFLDDGRTKLVPNSTVDNDMCNATLNDWMTSFAVPLYESHFLLAIIYCCMVAISFLVGLIGNVVILCVNTVGRTATSRMNRIGRDFVINLALADLCVTTIADPMCILGKYSVACSLERLQ